jgi:hypothetical protein
MVQVLTVPLEGVSDDIKRAGGNKGLLTLGFVKFTDRRGLEIDKSV